MTTIQTFNPLASMLNKSFTQLDQDASKGLDRGEFKAMYEMLKPGLAADKEGRFRVSEDAEFKRMDHNADGQVNRAELLSTDVLMPAELTDDKLTSMIAYLKQLDTFSAREAASRLSAPDLP
jgi:Ca2+-binding EF-hand superfamily protein